MRATGLAASVNLLFVAGCAFAPPGDPLTAPYPEAICPSCAEWNAPHRPFRIFGNTYYVGTEGLASVLVTSSEGHVLIDGGLPNTAPLIQENIRALGFDMADVALILNSHAHFDHAGGIAALQRASGARVVASPPSASVIQRGNSAPDDPQYGVLLDFPPVLAVEDFSDGEAIMVGDLSFTPHITPVHAPGGTTWSWRSCEAGECVNLVFADSQTPISAEGFRFSERSDLASFERGFAVLEGLACDILITPHPGASSFWDRYRGPAGLVDPSACQRYAAAARERLARRLDDERGQRDQESTGTAGTPQECVAAVSAPALDHVVLVVRDLDRASAPFRAHGFRLKDGRLHANNLLNRHVKFRDGSSLELMTVQGEPLDDMARDYAALAASGEGGVYVALEVDSMAMPEGAAAALGLESLGSSAGSWRFLSFPSTVPAAAIFFSEGLPLVQDPDSLVSHDPDVTGLAEAWVEGGGELTRLLEELGARRCGSARSPDGRTGERLALARGSIVVVERSGSARPRVLGAVLRLRSQGGGTVWPHPEFWVQYRPERGVDL